VSGKIVFSRREGFAAVGGVALVALMLVLVSVTKIRAGIVPEVGAVSSGLLFFRARAWLDQLLAFYLFLVAGASLGLVISVYLSWNIDAKIALALAIVVIGLALTRVPALPALSASLLPVYLNYTSWSYPVAVAVFMGLASLGAYLWIKPKFSRASKPEWDLTYWVMVVGSLAICIIALAIYRSPLLIVPPFFVAMTEKCGRLKRAQLRLEDLARIVWLIVPFEISIGLYVLTHSYYVVLIALAVGYLGSVVLGIELVPAFALGIIPLVFSVSTDERLAYLGLFATLITQLAPVVVRGIIDASEGAKRRLSARTLEPGSDSAAG